MNAPEISIFLDTNCLETREGKNILHLFELKVPAEFYALCRFIAEHDLSEKVEICISEITWMEIKEHLFTCYKDTHETLKNNISTHKKRLGSLLDIDYSIAHTSAREYSEHIETITAEFIDSNICKIITYPRTVELLDVLVKKAVRTQAPFCNAKRHNGKEYSDAGFKDALIAETIISYCNENKTLGVFITKDHDFGKNAEQPIEILDAIDKAKEYLSSKYGLTDEDQIKRSFEADKYLQEKIILETGNPYDESVLNFIVNEVEKIDESDLFNIISQCQINETLYRISFIYDKGANEIFDVVYELQNE